MLDLSLNEDENGAPSSLIVASPFQPATRVIACPYKWSIESQYTQAAIVCVVSYISDFNVFIGKVEG